MNSFRDFGKYSFILSTKYFLRLEYKSLGSVLPDSLCSNGDRVDDPIKHLNEGFNLVMLGADNGFMMRLARQELRAARDETGTESSQSGQTFTDISSGLH